jgi:DJ-1 family protein
MLPRRTALVILASGSEEMEAAIVVDVLRRAEVSVTLAGLGGAQPITCSRNVRIVPDVALEATLGSFDAIVLPGGGPGSERLADSKLVGKWLKAQWDRGGIVAAVCAAPIALLAHGIGRGLPITCHPSVRERLLDSYELSDRRVVESGQLITSQGPGTSFEFALSLVRRLCGEVVAKNVAAPLLLPQG